MEFRKGKNTPCHILYAICVVTFIPTEITQKIRIVQEILTNIVKKMAEKNTAFKRSVFTVRSNHSSLQYHAKLTFTRNICSTSFFIGVI